MGMGAGVHTRGNRRSRAEPARARPGTHEPPGRVAAVSFACGYARDVRIVLS